MLTSERKALILDALRRDGRVVAKTLSRDWDVSEDTIRRDLRDLAAEGLLQRVHGGAMPASPALAPLVARQDVAIGGKAAIGRAAAAMVQPGQIVMLDGGTTAAQVARHLDPDLDATFFTHSPTIAGELALHRNIEIELIGGRLFRHSMVAVGAGVAEAIGRIRFDVFFMGVTGVHAEHGLTTGDGEEAAIKRALSRHAAETVVLASHEKLGAVSPFTVVGLDEVNAIVVDGSVSNDIAESIGRVGVSLVVA